MSGQFRSDKTNEELLHSLGLCAPAHDGPFQESQTLDGPEVWKSIETWKMYSYSVTRKEENDATACDL